MHETIIVDALDPRQMWVQGKLLTLNMVAGVWNDSNVEFIAFRPHQCQCLAESLPFSLHPLSLHVSADESEVRVHQGGNVPILGSLNLLESTPWRFATPGQQRT